MPLEPLQQVKILRQMLPASWCAICSALLPPIPDITRLLTEHWTSLRAANLPAMLTMVIPTMVLATTRRWLLLTRILLPSHFPDINSFSNKTPRRAFARGFLFYSEGIIILLSDKVRTPSLS